MGQRRGALARVLDEPELAAPFGGLRASEGHWSERDDVYVSYVRGADLARGAPGALVSGRLGVGFGAYAGRHHFGPELALGRALGGRFEVPVLLVKVAFGGESLAVDFRPPSAGGAVGPRYTALLAQLEAALAPESELFRGPLAGRSTLLDGVVWFQGWNDACDAAATAAYAANLAHLVGDLCAALGDAALPFVVGETGNWDGEEFRARQREGCARASATSAATLRARRAVRGDTGQTPGRGRRRPWIPIRQGFAVSRARKHRCRRHIATYCLSVPSAAKSARAASPAGSKYAYCSAVYVRRFRRLMSDILAHRVLVGVSDFTEQGHNESLRIVAARPLGRLRECGRGFVTPNTHQPTLRLPLWSPRRRRPG